MSQAFSTIPLELPIGDMPAQADPIMRAYWTAFRTRLTDWTHKVSLAAQALTTGIPGMLAGAPLVGTVDGANTTFTFPQTIAMDANGNPQAMLFFRGEMLYYVAGAPKAQEWTMSGQNIILGTPPQPGDDLRFGIVGVVP